MSRKFKIRDQEAVILLPSQPFNGLTFLPEPNIATFSLIAFDIAKRTKGWKFMPTAFLSSHVHMIVARHGKQPLEHVIRDIKKSSLKIIEAINSTCSSHCTNSGLGRLGLEGRAAIDVKF